MKPVVKFDNDKFQTPQEAYTYVWGYCRALGVNPDRDPMFVLSLETEGKFSVGCVTYNSFLEFHYGSDE